jgi:SAM-dependent MidA family methyltransferase
MLTCTNAMAFHSFSRAHPRQTYDILEVGVGSGLFASGFLQELARQDESHRVKILPRIRYMLADFSQPILERAKQNILKENPNANIRTVLMDASSSVSINNAIGVSRFDLIRANELFDDLPAEAYCTVNDKIKLVQFDSKMKPVIGAEPKSSDQMPTSHTVLGQTPASPTLSTSQSSPNSTSLEPWEEVLLRALPEGYFIPLNRKAVESVRSLSEHLRPTGWLDIFDYGFYFKQDFGLFNSIWNEHLVREFNGQWTVDVNFLYLAAALRQAGFNKITVERQKDYVQNVIGRPLALADSAPGEEDGENGSDNEMAGLDYAEKPINDIVPDLEEDDFFYHLQVKV